MKRYALCLVAGILPLGLTVGQSVDDSGCTDDHWNPICYLNQMHAVGSPYFACASGGWKDGVQFCCKYSVQNYACDYPPPDIGKFFDFTGYEHAGACVSTPVPFCPTGTPPGG